jgi:hypothetical protein
MAWWNDRKVALGVAAAVGAVGLLGGFGGGFFAAKLSDGGLGGAENGATGERPGIISAMFGKPRDGGAPRAGLPRPQGFAVWRQRVDASGSEPKACVEFSRPLDASKSYGDYVLVSPDPGRPPAVTVRGAELCLTGLGFYDRRVTLLKGLPGRGGDVLAANADVDFTFGEKPPYVGFAGNGVILPREDSDGVGIETVNVSRLNVEVWRVPDRNLVRKELNAPEPTAEGDYGDDYGSDSPDDEGRVVWKGELPVTGGTAGQRTTTVFPLGAVLKEMKAGAYVIKARDASGARGLGEDPDEGQPARARRWILYTDMALIAYQGAEGLDVTVRSLGSARPLSGVRLALVARNGETLAEAKSDGEGHARFAKALLGGEGAADAKAVMAYGPGADFTTMDLDRAPTDLSNQGIGGRLGETESVTGGRAAATTVDAYLYSDRGVYRPGETVRLVALLRDREAKTIKDRKGALVIRRPSGVEAFRYRFGATPKGFASADFVLPRSAPRGRWTVGLNVEGLEEQAGSLSFSVEDFAPQRLAVDVNGDVARPLGAAETRPVRVDARFLYGAPGAGLQVTGEARLKADTEPFRQFRDYRFGDEQAPFEEKFVELGQTVTDGEGRATVNLDAGQGGDTAQPLKALFTASVFEPGGRPVREGVELKLRGKPAYLGVKIDPGEEGAGRDPLINMDVVAVNAAGGRLALSGVNWTLVSENWDYDWFQQEGRWQWRRTSRDVVAARGSFDVGSAAPAKLARRLGWGDYRLVLEHAATGARTVVRFASGWGSPAGEREAPDFVRVSAGAERYDLGDTVAVTIKGAYAGQAQIAVATDRIIELKTVNVPREGATVRLRATAAWGGGAYVLVTVVQPRHPVTAPKPRRAVGLVYVPIDPGRRRLQVAVEAPEKQRGRDVLEVPVRVQGLSFGQRARVTVAAVDEGILRLTKFETPDPVKWWFGKRALAIDYRDDYGRLLDPNLGAPAALNYGADEIGGEGLTTTPIKTVALWSGVVETGLDGRARIRLPSPDFNGQLRLMAVAWTDEAVGSDQQDVTVREPVVAELALPRFLSPGDRAFATLELHNVEGRPGLYTALIQGRNGVVAMFRKAYQLILGQRVMERVEIAAPARASVGEVGFEVTGEQFAYATRYGLQTRVGWGEETRVITGLQRPGETWTPPADLLAGFTPGGAIATVSYSPIRGVDPIPIAATLARYPYGCTEQIISAAYPWLFAHNGTAGAKTAKRAHPLLSQAVGRLLDRQSTDGAFGLWRVGDGEADPWVGAYATDFLVEARTQGAPVPKEALDRALSAMQKVARPDGWAAVSYRMSYPESWAGSSEASQRATERMRSRASAYALYVLAKAGRGDLARLRWQHDVNFKQEQSPLARAQVGAGLALMGDRARARSAFRQAAQSLGYRDEQDWYGSPLRDLAGIIALSIEAGERDFAQGLQRRLEDAAKDPDSLNTQEQARMLQAASAMLRAAGPVRIDAVGVTPLVSTGGAQRWGLARLAEARFANRSVGALWRTVTVRGSPASAPGASASGVTLQKAFFTLQGAAADPSSLSQGQRVVIRLSGSNGQARTAPLVVDDALPAGFEIETTLSPEDAENGPFAFLGELTAADAQEARDDRYVAAFDLPGNERFAVAYVARAVTPGDFHLPGGEARDLYRPGIFARTAASRTVIAAGS